MADDNTREETQEEIKKDDDMGQKGGQVTSETSDVDFESDMGLEDDLSE